MPPALADGFFTPSATWNQGKSEAVKQEMARVNVDILGISKLKWTKRVNLTQMTILSTIVGRNLLEEMEKPSWSTKESKMQYLDAISKKTEWSLFVSKAGLFNITVIQAYAPTSNTEEAEVERFYKDLQDLLELTPKRDVLFITRD